MPEGSTTDRLIRLTPSGRLRPTAAGEAVMTSASPLRGALEAFRADDAAGLFELAARPTSGGLPADLSFWRDFASLFLSQRCHTPLGVSVPQRVPALSEADAASLFLGAPPMEGAEYLSPDLLARLWATLDEWVLREAAAAGGLEAFLSGRAPLWRQVGRVCFHLAENRKDPDYPFAFLATYAPRISQSARLQYQPLSRALQEFAGERNRKALVNLLTPVQRAAEKSPLIRELSESGDIYHPLAWTREEAYRFLLEAPLYEESGVLVRMPDWWTRRPRPQVAVRVGSKSSGGLGMDAILDFSLEVAVGDETLTERELKALLAGEDGLAFLKGRWVEVDKARLAEALAHWKKVEKKAAEGGLSFVDGMRLLAGAPADLAAVPEDRIAQWSFVDAGPWLKDVLSKLRDPESIASALPGRDLHAVLRPYQEAGVRWLGLLSGLGLGACLADDMGLGKTVQVLALLLVSKRKAAPPSLLVLPASLLSNWKAEIDRFAPSLRARFLHPSFGADGSPASATELGGVDVVLTTYGMLAREPWVEKVDWNLVVLDEAQAIKNPGSRQSKAVKRLRARARIALTGTPVENSLADIWSLFDFLSPGLLGSASRFREFSKSLETRRGERYAPLRNLVRPYILRRLKTDRSVIADLPEKTEVKAFCGLSRRQAALYRSVVEELEESLSSSDGMRRRGLILASLMRLKQVCNHPSQLSGDGGWAPEDSGKFSRLRQLCEEISSRQDRCLVFTQFREMTEPLAAFLAGIFGRPGLVLHGQTPVKARQALVESFQSEDGPPFFVLSLKAGGTGLNLTAASHVIHFDRWWNPAVENQATDRAFRIGQKRNVLVHKFVCRGTVEEKIDELIGEKTELSRDLLEGGGETMLTEMDDARLLALVGLDLERARTD